MNSSFCGFLGHLNNGNTSIFDMLESKPDPIIKDILYIAYDKYSDGDISKVLFTNLTA